MFKPIMIRNSNHWKIILFILTLSALGGTACILNPAFMAGAPAALVSGTYTRPANPTLQITTTTPAVSSAQSLSGNGNVGGLETYQAIVTYPASFTFNGFLVPGPVNSQVGNVSVDVNSDGIAEFTYPIRSVDANNAYADISATGTNFIGFVPSIVHTQTVSSHIFTITLPLGGDNNATTVTATAAVLLTLTVNNGIITNPSVMGDYFVAGDFTSVDPETDDANNLAGLPPLTFKASMHTPIGIQSTRLGDYNGDGAADIIQRDLKTGKNRFNLPSAGAFLQAGQPPAPAALTAIIPALTDLNWFLAGKGDFNGDGKSDLLWRHGTTGQNFIWFMNGSTIASSGSTVGLANANWRVVAVDDFNGDGNSDLLWRNSASGLNVMWFMNGTAVAGSGVTVSLSNFNWQLAGSGDFDGDGKADLLWRNIANGQNFIWFMNGTTITTSGPTTGLVDTNWWVAGINDFNGDGIADILWRRTTTGQNFIWFMNGRTVAGGGAAVSQTDQNWQVAGTGDVNADGKADILWSNKSTGEKLAWLMNGKTNTGTMTVPSLGTDTDWHAK